MAELLRQVRLRVDTHRLLRLHAALAHGSRRDGAASELVDELLVAHTAIVVLVARLHQAVEEVIGDGHVPHVERTRDLLLGEAARAVEVDVLEGLEHVREARVQALLGHREQLLELLLLLVVGVDVALRSGRRVLRRRRLDVDRLFVLRRRCAASQRASRGRPQLATRLLPLNPVGHLLDPLLLHGLSLQRGLRDHATHLVDLAGREERLHARARGAERAHALARRHWTAHGLGLEELLRDGACAKDRRVLGRSRLGT